MKSYDYEAVYYDSSCYCVSCLPDGVNVEDDEVSPIFADSEVDSYPVCEQCGGEHDYMSLTTEGIKQRKLSKYAPAVATLANDKGDLCSFTSLGCYPLLYVDEHGAELCAKCASDPDSGDKIVAGDVYWEGPDTYCDECNETIESAYGDPDADDNETGENP